MTNVKIVYVAGPFSAPTREGIEANIMTASLAGIEVARLGFCPLVPHANTAHPLFEKVQPYRFWIEATTELLRRCDAALFIEGWNRSSGATGEHREAERLGIPRFYQLDELERWGRGLRDTMSPPAPALTVRPARG